MRMPSFGRPEGLITGETVLVDGEPVENVLVSPSDREAVELADITLPLGQRIYCRLDIPKEFTEPLHGRTVTVRGEELKVVDDRLAYEDANTPGEWNRYAFAARSTGDYADAVEVVRLVASIDELGDPVTARETVYSGPAQARMASGSESGGAAIQTDAAEKWYFVMPWQDAFADLRPQSTIVVYNAVDYGVESIEDVDNAGETATFEAVRHG